jgi:hypothetical protein
VTTRIDLGVAGVTEGGLPVALAPPPYARFGDAAAFILWVLLIVSAWASVKSHELRR